MFRWGLAFNTAFLVVAGLCNYGSGQSMRDIFELDFIHANRTRENPHAASSYWIDIAKSEIKKIRSGKRPHLNDANQVVLELQEALAPIFETEQILINFPRGPDRELVLKDLSSLYQSEEIAENVFSVLGVEHCIMLACELSNARIKTFHSKAENQTGLRTHLHHELFGRVLNLTQSQSAEIRSEIQAATEKVEAEIQDLLERLDANLDRRWTALLAVLPAPDRETAKKRIGRPIAWHRVLPYPTFRNRVTNAGDFNGGMILGPNVLKISTPPESLTDAEMENYRVERFDNLVFNLFLADSLWFDLGLSSEQKQWFEDSLKGKVRNAVYAEPERGRFQSLMKGDAEYPKSVVEFYEEEQLVRFAQIEFLFRLGETYDSTVGLLHPAMVDLFELSPHQQRKMERIASRFDAEEQHILGELSNIRSRAQMELESDLAVILTEEQHELFLKYTGERLGD